MSASLSSLKLSLRSSSVSSASSCSSLLIMSEQLSSSPSSWIDPPASSLRPLQDEADTSLPDTSNRDIPGLYDIDIERMSYKFGFSTPLIARVTGPKSLVVPGAPVKPWRRSVMSASVPPYCAAKRKLDFSEPLELSSMLTPICAGNSKKTRC